MKNLCTLVAAAVLATGTLALYGPALRFDFLDYDDPVYVTQNPWVLKGLRLETLRLALNERVGGNWHPLTMISHLLDVSLFGTNAAGHHGQSLFWHAANVVLLFLLVSRLPAGFWPGAAVAALWAAHPVNVDSVAWIAERKNLLSTFFWLATVAGYVHYTRAPSPNRLLIVLVLFGLALMAKPMPVTLPFTLLLLDYWPLRRVEGWGRKSFPVWKALCMEKLPLFVLCAVFILTTFQTQAAVGAIDMGPPLPRSARLAWIPLWYLDYLRVFFWPSGLCVLYPRPLGPPPPAAALLAVLALLAVTGLAWRAKSRFPSVLAGWLWFLGTLIPVIGLVPLGLHATADRYLYVPMLGLLVPLAWTLRAILVRRWRVAAGLLAAAALTAAAATTRHVLPHWKNSDALFRRALAVTHGNYAMHYNLARQLTLAGRYDEALGHLHEALRLYPGYSIAHNNLGWTLLLKGESAAAIPHFEESLRLTPWNYQARMNLALALRQLGRVGEAREQLVLLLREAPDYPNARELLQTLPPP